MFSHLDVMRKERTSNDHIENLTLGIAIEKRKHLTLRMEVLEKCIKIEGKPMFSFMGLHELLKSQL